MKAITRTPVLFYLAVASGAACAASHRPSEFLRLADDRSTALLVTFQVTQDEASTRPADMPHACPIKVENPSDGSQFLLRHSIQRDSVEQHEGTVVTYPHALGDYEPLTPGALALRSGERIRLDCQTLRSVAIVPRGA